MRSKRLLLLKFKLLLLLTLAPIFAHAQCPKPEGVDTTLIISEVRFISRSYMYVELTNVGTEPIQLSEFKLGRLTMWSETKGIKDLCNDPWTITTADAFIFLPERELAPGESWVLTNAYDFSPVRYKQYKGRNGGSERPKQIQLYEVADKLIHMEELIEGIYYPEDSVTDSETDPEATIRRGDYQSLFTKEPFDGAWYLEHQIPGDSVVVDQVGGVFDHSTGRNEVRKVYDVAGVPSGAYRGAMIRKNIVKSGRLDYANSTGLTIDDSDWIPIPHQKGYDQWRDIWWTIGNHGDYVLNENTLEPIEGSTISVDYPNKKITVPWGTRRLDEIMRNMTKKPGVAWNYFLNDVKTDSLYRSARNGDRLVVYVVGNTLTLDTFDIVVNDPTTDANIVIPIDHPDYYPDGPLTASVSNVLAIVGSPITQNTQDGILSWPRVTKHATGMDTITGSGYGLEFDMRSDTLLKYLEKPANATWEFVWVDGVERADLKEGDILKVTSESGKSKEYYIQIQEYRPSQNTNLSAITWPDIPESYRNFLGWMGDTIPNFSSGTNAYRLNVPFDVPGVPALNAIKQDYNATLETKRARSVYGTPEERTIKFTVTAEDDTISADYTVELEKEKLPADVEPFKADPFFSEFENGMGPQNPAIEIYNPGNKPIDLRNYAFGMINGTDSYAPVTKNWSTRWDRRYTLYIPGTRYVATDQTEWEANYKMLEPDVNINPILNGGETFTMALIRRENYVYPHYDINFANEEIAGHPNPWGEDITIWSGSGAPIPPNGNRKNSFYLYKVLNDSIKQGLKPVGDAADFELIDMWGMPDGGYWIVGDNVIGVNATGESYIRKADVNKGNPERGGSFGLDNPDESEWITINRSKTGQSVASALGSLGSHFMNPITFYQSTVTSILYKVSSGYGMGQEILGVTTGTTVTEFLGNIYKADTGQTLTVLAGADTLTVIDAGAAISPDDVLKVVSADEQNTTIYRIDVTDNGLSSDAVLTSSKWTITVPVAPDASQDVVGEGLIAGFEYGSSLNALKEFITVPTGATMTVYDKNGSYVPFKILNYSDTIYREASASVDYSIEVLAEDGMTKIVYGLEPASSESDAFLYSDAYKVSQESFLVEYVPSGVAFNAFTEKVIPSVGATMKLYDKAGLERTTGNLKADDKVEVTSANGEVTNTYYLSLIFPGSSISYFAYIVSQSYFVDQVEYIISGSALPLTDTATVEDLAAELIPSIGASFVVIDADGNEKTTGTLVEGDQIQVTSADGNVVTLYDIDLSVASSYRVSELTNLEIYPNPTSGLLNINGLDAGKRIQIYTIEGTMIQDIEVQSYYETISLETVPRGLFLVIIRDNNQILGKFKAIKE